MARAKRHYISGEIWHITHRCYKRDFLLKLVQDRRKWLQWLFDAKRRNGLIILNYTVTSNHIHLLVVDEGERDVIPDSIKLVAGRTGQEYNNRKKRKGAFWEFRGTQYLTIPHKTSRSNVLISLIAWKSFLFWVKRVAPIDRADGGVAWGSSGGVFKNVHEKYG